MESRRDEVLFTGRQVGAAVCNFVALLIAYEVVELGSPTHRRISAFCTAFSAGHRLVDNADDCGDHMGYGDARKALGETDTEALEDWGKDVS